MSHTAEQFEHALGLFLQAIRDLQANHFATRFKNLTPPTIDVDPGGIKYVRVVKSQTGSRAVYCFVERATGDILKADGWKRPAKHARGNIFNNAGKDAITPWGVHYINNGSNR